MSDKTAAPDAASAENGSGDGAVPRTAKRRSIWTRLYHGETNFDFVGRRKLWFTLSLVAVLIGLGSLLTRGLNLGIDFEGGVVWEVPAGDASVADARGAIDEFGLGNATTQELQSDEGTELRVEAEPVSADTSDQVTDALAQVTGSSADAVSLTSVGPSWGREISDKAIRALIVFLVLVTIYIALRFELKMALPTLVALIHDVLITIGVYALTQLEVTPATVIAVLTILGYSIYDGIVVFDKVDENTRLVSSTGGLSYGGMVNVSLPEHDHHRAAAGGVATRRRLVDPGRSRAPGVRDRPPHRPVLRGVLVAVHCVADAGVAQGARAPLSRHQAADRRPRR
jgi:preprotein translocase subunit SecF